MSVTLKRSLGDGGAAIDESHGAPSRLYQVLAALVTGQNAAIAAFNNHTHAADGSETGAYNTSMPQSDAEDVSQGTAVALVQQVTAE